jgi:hypothetical protein
MINALAIYYIATLAALAYALPATFFLVIGTVFSTDSPYSYQHMTDYVILLSIWTLILILPYHVIFYSIEALLKWFIRYCLYARNMIMTTTMTVIVIPRNTAASVF